MDWHTYFTFDPETGNLIWKERPLSMFDKAWHANSWNARYSNKVAGKVSCKNGKADSWRITFGKRTLKAHRVIWEMVYGPIPEGILIDHIDQNPLNNRLSNMRLATHTQNMRNTCRPSREGYFLRRLAKPWTAQIRRNGKRTVLGRFATEQEAKEAYQKACQCK